MNLQEIRESAENGKISFCEAYAMAKNIEKELKSYTDEIHSAVLEEVSTFNKGEKYHGFVWEIRRGVTTYNYEESEEYVQANERLKEIRKNITIACKMAAENKQFFDEGVQVEAVSIKSVARDSIIFKAK